MFVSLPIGRDTRPGSSRCSPTLLADGVHPVNTWPMRQRDWDRLREIVKQLIQQLRESDRVERSIRRSLPGVDGDDQPGALTEFWDKTEYYPRFLLPRLLRDYRPRDEQTGWWRKFVDDAWKEYSRTDTQSRSVEFAVAVALVLLVHDSEWQIPVDVALEILDVVRWVRGYVTWHNEFVRLIRERGIRSNGNVDELIELLLPLVEQIADDNEDAPREDLLGLLVRRGPTDPRPVRTILQADWVGNGVASQGPPARLRPAPTIGTANVGELVLAILNGWRPDTPMISMYRTDAWTRRHRKASLTLQDCLYEQVCLTVARIREFLPEFCRTSHLGSSQFDQINGLAKGASRWTQIIYHQFKRRALSPEGLIEGIAPGNLLRRLIKRFFQHNLYAWCPLLDFSKFIQQAVQGSFQNQIGGDIPGGMLCIWCLSSECGLQEGKLAHYQCGAGHNSNWFDSQNCPDCRLDLTDAVIIARKRLHTGPPLFQLERRRKCKECGHHFAAERDECPRPGCNGTGSRPSKLWFYDDQWQPGQVQFADNPPGSDPDPDSDPPELTKRDWEILGSIGKSRPRGLGSVTQLLIDGYGMDQVEADTWIRSMLQRLEGLSNNPSSPSQDETDGESDSHHEKLPC